MSDETWHDLNGKFVSGSYLREQEMRHKYSLSLTQDSVFHLTSQDGKVGSQIVSACCVNGNLLVKLISDDNVVPLFELVGHEEPVTSSSFCRNSGVLLSSSWDKTVRLWKIPSSNTCDRDEEGVSGGSIKILPTLTRKFHSKRINSCITFKCSTGSISGGNDESLFVWDFVKDYHYLHPGCHNSGYITSLDIGESTIVCGFQDGSGGNLRIFDLRTRKKVFSFKNHPMGVMDISLHPNTSDVFLSCGVGGKVFCYDMRNMKSLYSGQFRGRTNSVDFHSSGRYFAIGQSSGQTGGCVSVVDLRNSNCREFNVRSRVNCCHFTDSPRNMALCVGTMEGGYVYKTTTSYPVENSLYNPLEKFDFHFVGDKVYLFLIQTDFGKEINVEGCGKERYLQLREEEIKRHVEEMSPNILEETTVLVLNEEARVSEFKYINVYYGVSSLTEKEIKGSIICVFGGKQIKTNLFSFSDLERLLSNADSQELHVVILVNKFQIKGSSFFKALIAHLKRKGRVVYDCLGLKEIL